MKVSVMHPQTAQRNIPAEHMFLATDALGTKLGEGYIIPQFQPHLYPDCPINLYFDMQCQPSARYVLFGALVAQARQLREINRDLQARMYTNLSPADSEMLRFYEHNGFLLSDEEQEMELYLPEGDGVLPMNCSVADIPLNTMEEQAAFIQRLWANDINYLDASYLLQMKHTQPHFLAMGLYRNNDLAGEVLLHGIGDTAELSAIYITSAMRRQGMGHALLHRAMAVMAREGVSRITTRILTRSTPQKQLMASFGGRTVGTSTIFPGLFL